MLLLEGCDLVVVVAGRREKENGVLKRGSQGNGERGVFCCGIPMTHTRIIIAAGLSHLMTQFCRLRRVLQVTPHFVFLASSQVSASQCTSTFFPPHLTTPLVKPDNMAASGIFVVGAKRTAFGSFGGSLSKLT